MPYVQATSAPTAQLYYQDIGQGRPVVLVHGWPLSHRMWEPQINALTEAGFRCIAYDRRGFGDSEKPSGGYDYDTFAADLRDVIVALDLRDAAIAGFSMGGGEVARYFGRYGADRVSKAMLIGAVPPFLLKTDDNPEGADRSVFDGMLAGVVQDRITFLDGFVRGFYNLAESPGAVSEETVQYNKAIAWFASPLATQRCIVAFGTTDFRPDMAKITVPTLVVHGDADRIVPLEISGKKAAEMIADSRLEVIAGGPHGIAATHADRLSELMLDFLRS